MGTSNLHDKLFSHKLSSNLVEDNNIDDLKNVKDPMPCYRCQRSSHQSTFCHAKRDVDGNLIALPPTVSLTEINEKSKSEKQKIQKKKLLAKKLLKTKMIDCEGWKTGKCTKGDNCMFSHQDLEGFDPRSKQLCHFHKLGSCLKGTLCVFSHTKKDFPCVYFHKKSLSCSFTRETCEYHHNPLSDSDKLFLDHIEQNYASKQASKIQNE